ncbi:amidase domain-containing protein [Streptomyces telluris]|uniref:Amidase domain-containing protein n=1 Tax=Streptomyces telluris TaxID=2720021 RepID=A0A9X2LFZ7_9ACTN|nr:amidase domain-containing protein [Streptomyces telluris]MCQ8770661.1 amidase domain-containing protein [Streptomyces telluris]
MTVAATAALLPTSAAFAAGKPDSRPADSATVEAFGRIADAVLNDRTSVLLDSRSADRKATKVDGKVRLSSGLSKAEDTGLSSLKMRKTWLAALGEAYTGADTKTSVDKTTVKGNRATVRVTETTVLTYKKIRGDEPSTTGFTAHHELSFSLGKNGKWELTGIRPQDDGPGAINEPRTAVAATGSIDLNGSPAATRYPGSRNAKPKTLTSTTKGGLDYKAMAAYAEKYWRNYNPAYRSFNSYGGDCTNFISQALKAGGWKDAAGTDTSDYRKWWYNKSSQSDSWVGANEWSWHTLSTKRATNLSNVYQMDVGDILQMDFDGDGSKDHSMMTTYRSRMGVPYLTYHSTNTYRKSVASIIASYPGAIYYAYRT